MAFSNIALNDLYFTWVTRTNQLVNYVNNLDATNILNFHSNSAPILVSPSAFRYGDIYIGLTLSSDTSDANTANIASAGLVNTVYQYARSMSSNTNAAIAVTYSQGNTAYLQANTAYGQANTALITAQGAFLTANNSNLALVTASIATAYGQANTAYNTANNAYGASNTAYNTANTVLITAQSAFTKANAGATLASVSDYRTGTDTTKALGVANTWAAAAEVSVADASTITLDMSTGINFNVNITTRATRTLATPTNMKAGQSGSIRVRQGGPTAQTWSYGSGWNFPSGAAPVLSTGTGNTDLLFYQAFSTSNVVATIIKDIRFNF